MILLVWYFNLLFVYDLVKIIDKKKELNDKNDGVW